MSNVNQYKKNIADSFYKAVPKPHGYELVVTSQSVQSVSGKICVVFLGGPAPGGHNVVAGLYDGLVTYQPNLELIGARDGLISLINEDFIQLNINNITPYIDQGGFQLLGTCRYTLSDIAMDRIRDVCLSHKITTLVLIGGNGTHYISEKLCHRLKKDSISVLVVPKTIDGDIRFEGGYPSFGVDSYVKSCVTMMQNVARDILSTKKYYHIVRMMGRKSEYASNAVAFHTRPNIYIPVPKQPVSLMDICHQINVKIQERQQRGLEWGIVLLCEGITDMLTDFDELQKMILQGNVTSNVIWRDLTCYERQFLKEKILSKAPIPLSQIPIEKVIASVLNEFTPDIAFNTHFMGYNLRSVNPSVFDAHYTFLLGYGTALAIFNRLSGVSVNLSSKDPLKWCLFNLGTNIKTPPVFELSDHTLSKTYPLESLPPDTLSVL